MASQALLQLLSPRLKPLCPRDHHVMHYQAAGVTREAGSGKRRAEPAYHCGYEGCSVRYNSAEGYFTVVKTPDEPYFLEEPGANLFRCARHGGWMHQSANEGGTGMVWRCAVPGCDFTNG